MIDQPPSPDENHEKSTDVQQEVLAMLHRAGNILGVDEHELNDKVVELFWADISPDMIEQERHQLEKWRRFIRDKATGHSGYIGLGNVSDETAMTSIAMNRARNFWRHGLKVSEDRYNVASWLTITSRPIFASIAERTNVYPEVTVSSRSSPGDKIGGGCRGKDLFEAIVRVGDEDEEYLSNMAAYVHHIASSEASEVPTALRTVAKGFITQASAHDPAQSAYIHTDVTSWRQIPEATFTPEAFLATEIEKLQSAARETLKPSEALARVEFLSVNNQTAHWFEHLRTILASSLRQEDSKKQRRDSLDFVRGASRLLFNSLAFAASPDGLNSENAAIMCRYLHEHSGRHGRQTTPSRRALIALANQITPDLAAALNHDDLSPLDPEAPFDTYFAIDRLFTFIEYEADTMERNDISELVNAVADCSLQLADHGFKEITISHTAYHPQQDETLLMDDPGPKARRRALHRAGVPGYGKIS